MMHVAIIPFWGVLALVTFSLLKSWRGHRRLCFFKSDTDPHARWLHVTHAPVGIPLAPDTLPLTSDSSVASSFSVDSFCVHSSAFATRFLLSRCAELTNRRFKVMDDERLSDDLAAWACFRLDRLRPGLRILHLYDSNGVITKGVLLVRIAKTVSRA